MVPDVENPGSQKNTQKINVAVVDVVVSDIDGLAVGRMGVYCQDIIVTQTEFVPIPDLDVPLYFNCVCYVCYGWLARMTMLLMMIL